MCHLDSSTIAHKILLHPDVQREKDSEMNILTLQYIESHRKQQRPKNEAPQGMVPLRINLLEIVDHDPMDFCSESFNAPSPISSKKRQLSTSNFHVNAITSNSLDSDRRVALRIKSPMELWIHQRLYLSLYDISSWFERGQKATKTWF